MLNITIWWRYKNIVRHTEHSIVSWLSPEQLLMIRISHLMIRKLSKIILKTTTKREIGKLITHSPMCCIKIIKKIPRLVWGKFHRNCIYMNDVTVPSTPMIADDIYFIVIKHPHAQTNTVRERKRLLIKKKRYIGSVTRAFGINMILIHNWYSYQIHWQSYLLRMLFSK